MNNSGCKYMCDLTKIGLLLLLFISSSCVHDQSVKDKVIVVHARGVTYPDLMNYLKVSNSNVFFKLQESNGFIYKLNPIVNAVTICNIASFETGMLPSEHGIVGHSFGLVENNSVTPVSGFSQRFTTETFWEKADRNGKNVLNVGALILHGKHEKHNNVSCLAQGDEKNIGRFLQLIPYQESHKDSVFKYTNLEGDHQYRIHKGISDLLFVYMIGNEELIFDNDYNKNNGFVGKIKKGEWLEIENGKINSLKEPFRLKWIDTKDDTLNLYLRASFTNRGYPDEFVKLIDENVGGSKGWPNIPLYSLNQISGNTLIEEINSELDYVMGVFSYATQTKEYELIMIDYPLMDRYGHAFLNLKDSSQQIQKYYQNAFNRMDKDFYKILEFAKQNDYELIITSGHGFSPIHTSINIDKLLLENGINTNVQENTWEAKGIPGKVSAHIYINEQLEANKRENVLKKIEKTFENLYQPNSGKVVVDAIYRKNELDEIGMYHKSAGDLYILLNPGFVFQNQSAERNNIFDIPKFNGDHGYSLKHKESFGILISNEQCNPCRSTDVAKMVVRKLKLLD